MTITAANKGVQPIQDQSSVLGVDILNNPPNNYYGRSANNSQRIQLAQNISRVSFGALGRLNYAIV